MPNRAVLAFQRYVRDLIRTFRQSIGPLQPVLGKRKRRRPIPPERLNDDIMTVWPENMGVSMDNRYNLIR